MIREKKMQIIAKLADDLSHSTIVIATNYQGLTAKQIAELRNALGKTGAGYRVVKNTLARFAAEKAGREHVMDIIEGPVALVFGYDDVVSPAKALNQYIKSTESTLQIGGGLLGERILTPGEVVHLANLPPKEILVSRLITQLNTPIISLHNVLSSPLQGLLNVLHGKTQKFSE